jgi:uncharacterized membrane protein
MSECIPAGILAGAVWPEYIRSMPQFHAGAAACAFIAVRTPAGMNTRF